MLQALARLFGATRPVVQPAATGFPVVPLVGPLARPGTDVTGQALFGPFFQSAGRIGQVTFRERSVALSVYDHLGLVGLYEVEQPVFAKMFEIRGGLEGVLGADVQVRDTPDGLALGFCAVPVDHAGRPARAPGDWCAETRAKRDQRRA
jgi:hypothetical protein